MITQNSNFNNKESGVTLLLSILILSGLTLITITVSTFAIQELRASRAIIVTEPAIAAAESAGEQGLWSIKRSGTLSTCPTQNTQNFTNNTFINSCKSFGEATFNIKGGVPFTFYLFNPNYFNGNGDIDLSEYPYQWLDITHVSGSTSVSIAVSRINNTTTGLNPSSPPSINEGENVRVDISPVAVTSPETEGRIKVTLNSFGNVTVKVNTDRGMPTFPTVDALACSSRTTVTNCNSANQEIFSRRINITVPQ